ncbi:GNAT family N-acetyltransferase [Promicromonospora sukumoe]|uniref:GNAT family N-acetyltransferase n=1 Tax=Promicromonospora sukumoe TaxID=88382 RepID=UPI000366CBC5|nr:GNAT family N-acetyltransferase [Promicromonospora sukumoe]
MVAEVLAGLTVETVGWDHVDAVRLRADQQQEIDLRYAQPGRPSTTDADGAPVPDARDQVDPSNVFATLLLRVDGEPAGHAALRDLSGRDDYQGGLHPDGTAEVKRVYVAPGFRGRGLSRTLMTVAEDAARAAGVRHLILESGLMQPESLGLYLRLGYDPVESFGVFSDEPGSRCFGKWLVPDAAPVVEPVETPTSAPLIREVPWDDPDAAALRRAMWAYLEPLYPQLARVVEARGGHDVVDVDRGHTALVTVLATLDGRPVGCATLATSPVGPEHLTADPLRGVGGIAAAAAAGESRGFELQSVFVDPSVRRAGVASALVGHLEEEARRRGGLAAYLNTGIRQPTALRLYGKLGYRPVLPYPPYDSDDAQLLFLGKAL